MPGLIRRALPLALAASCSAPLERFDSEIGIVLVDTDGAEMGRRRSVEEGDWVDAAVQVFPAIDGGASTRGPSDYDGGGAIHVRGNSSREYDKVSFRLELRDGDGRDLAARLLDMSTDADWVLQGPYSDKSLIRNALIYQLSRDIGRYAPRTAPVELFVVDDRRRWSMRHYRGLYQLTERVEVHAERVDIAPMDEGDTAEPAISGGYLLKRDWFDAEDPRSFRTELYRDGLSLEEPDAPTRAQRQWIEAWLADFETALSDPDFADAERGYAAWIDVDAFVDHLLLAELGRSVDAYVLSTWMSKDRDGPLAMGPIWDYNGALGNADYFQAWKTAGWHFENPAFPKDNRNGFAWYARLLEDPAFRDRIAERWAAHRGGPWSDAALDARVHELSAALGAEPVERNFERWPVLGRYVWPNDESHEDRDSHAEEVDYLGTWLVERATWLDTATAELAGR